MPEATKPDLTDRGTQRLNVAPLQEKGTKFILFKCPDFKFKRLFTQTPPKKLLITQTSLFDKILLDYPPNQILLDYPPNQILLITPQIKYYWITFCVRVNV
jgi:hypothetical protein